MSGWAAAAQAVDSLAGSAFGIVGQAVQNSYNQRIAESNREHDQNMMSRQFAENQLNRDFQERMSNTQYTRAVKDMKSAGLNPMMMYGSSGMQASAPAGSSGGSGSAQSRPSEQMQLLQKAIESASSGAKRSVELKNLTKQTNANVSLLEQQKELAEVNTANAVTDGEIKRITQEIASNAKQWEMHYAPMKAFNEATKGNSALNPAMWNQALQDIKNSVKNLIKKKN